MTAARRTAAAVVAMILIGGGGSAGWAQTSTTQPPVTTTTTEPPPTTTTASTIPHPCTGQPCTEDPPNAILSGSRGEVQAAQGGYCWRDPTTDVTQCAAIARLPGAPWGPSLAVEEGETLTLRFTADLQPTEVSWVREGGEPAPLRAANPTQFTVGLPPGTHDVSFLTQWLQGDASYGVRLEVAPRQGPAPAPGPAPPAAPVAVQGSLNLTG